MPAGQTEGSRFLQGLVDGIVLGLLKTTVHPSTGPRCPSRGRRGAAKPPNSCKLHPIEGSATSHVFL